MMTNEGFQLMYNSFFKNEQIDRFEIGLTTIVFTELAENINDTQLSFDVANASVFTIVPCYIKVNDEIMYLSGITSNTLTVERGIADTTATSHTINDRVKNNHNHLTYMSELYEVTSVADNYGREILTRDATGFPHITIGLDGVEIITDKVTFRNTGLNIWDAAVENFICAIMPDTSERLICLNELNLPKVIRPEKKIDVEIKIKGIKKDGE